MSLNIDPAASFTSFLDLLPLVSVVNGICNRDELDDYWVRGPLACRPWIESPARNAAVRLGFVAMLRLPLIPFRRVVHLVVAS